MSETRKEQEKLKKENIQKTKLQNERNEVSKDTKHKQTGSKPRNFSLLQIHKTFSVFTPEKKPKRKLKKQEKNSPLIRATEKKNPRAGKTNQKLYLNQNPFDLNSTDPDAKRKKFSQHGGNVIATNPYYMNPTGLIVQEKGTKRENSSELKQEQVWNHTEVRKGCADEDKKKRCPSRQNPSNFFGNKANVTPQTIDATRARDRRETRREGRRARQGKGRATQASIPIVRLVKS